MGEVERKGVNSLSPEERAEKGFEAFRKHAAGYTYKDISATLGLNPQAVKKLIREQAAAATKHAPDARAVAKQTYRDLTKWGWKVLEEHADNPRRHSPLIVSKAAEIVLQSRVRQDKLDGVEAPQINISGNMKTAKEMIEEQMQSLGDMSPQDLAATYDEADLVVEAEEDEEDGDEYTEGF